jgi:hypothetical protein
MSNNPPLPQDQNIEPGANHSVQSSHPETEPQHLETIRQLTAERDQLQAELQALRAEHTRTVAALTEITDERNDYHRAVMNLTRMDITITEEELEEALKNPVPFEDFLREIGIDVQAGK